MSSRIPSNQPKIDRKAGSPLSSAASDSAETGSARVNLSAVVEQLSGDVPIRQDRVDALRSRIVAGTYIVNPHAVANAILQNLFGAKEELVREAGSCPIDRLQRSECIALGRCGCNRRDGGLQDSESPASRREEAHPLAG